MKILSILSALISSGATHGTASLTIAADVIEGETFTIGTDVFEFRTDDTPTVPTNRVVDVSAGLTKATALPAAAAAINDGTAYSAVVVNGSVVVIHDTPGVSVPLLETMSGSGNVWSAAALYGHAAPSEIPAIPIQQSRAVTAAEVAAGSFAVGFNGTVKSATVDVRTAAGAAKAYDGKVVISDRIVALDASGSVDLAATDVVTITAKLATKA